MEWVLLAAVVLEFLLYGPLIFRGGRALRQGADLRDPDEGWPKVAMLIPVAGMTPSTEEALRSLLRQDYPNYEAILCLEDEEEQAAPLARQIVHDGAPARIVFTGRTHSCSQKNHNLLAGWKSTVGAHEVLVFCDSTRVAPPSFLKALVAPIAHGQSRVTSGYHHVVFEGDGLLGAARAVTVLILYLTKTVVALNQPWGGATAIQRVLFEELDVEGLWRSTVVDDVTLARRLAKAGIRTALSRGACLSTLATDRTVSGYMEWLDRQWQYLKFVFPIECLAGGLNQHILAALSILSALSVAGLTVGCSSQFQGAVGGVFLIGVSLFGLVLHRLHPSAGPRSRWLLGGFLAIFLSSWSHMGTLFTRKVDWKGVRYSVGRGGRVTGIRRLS